MAIYVWLMNPRFSECPNFTVKWHIRMAQQVVSNNSICSRNGGPRRARPLSLAGHSAQLWRSRWPDRGLIFWDFLGPLVHLDIDSKEKHPKYPLSNRFLLIYIDLYQFCEPIFGLKPDCPPSPSQTSRTSAPAKWHTPSGSAESQCDPGSTQHAPDCPLTYHLWTGNICHGDVDRTEIHLYTLYIYT